MTEFYGPKVTRTAGDGDDSYDITVFQAGKPPLDSELNLVGHLNSEASAKILRATTPSGWLFDPLNAEDDFFTDASYHNVIAFGRQNETVANGLVTVDPNADGSLYAIVNGWVINATGSGTNLYVPLTSPTVSRQATATIQDITYTAVNPGTGGNLINIQYIVPSSGNFPIPNQPISVSVSGNAITVSLATNASGLPISTAAQVLAAVQGSSAASALVTGVISGSAGNIEDDTDGFQIFLTGGSSVGPPYYPGSIVNTDTRNLIVFPYAPSISYNVNFAFLEVWKALVSPNPSTANKPTASTIFAYGNTLFGGTNLPDDLIDPAMGFTTTLRTQIQYRIRVVQNVDLINHPDGLGDPSIYAIGAYSSNNPQTLNYQYQNMGQLLNDPGLWRAGDGNPANGLGTVDGYVYAIPICAVSRRNTTSFNMLDGGTANLNGAGVIRVPPQQLFGTPDGSIIPPNVLATVPLSDRPDGRYNDKIDPSDIIDLRHAVSPGGFDYASLLQGAFNKLVNGRLHTTPKLIPTNGSRFGTKLLYLDEISSVTNPAGNIIAIADDYRTLFSDASLQQTIVSSPISRTSKNPTSPSGTGSSWTVQDSYTLDLSTFTALSTSLPYNNQAVIQNVQVTYDGNYPVYTSAVTSATSGQVVIPGAVPTTGPQAVYVGYAIKVVGGTGTGQVVAIANGTTFPATGPTTLLVNPNWTVVPDSTSVIELVPFVAQTSAVTDEDGNVTVTITNLNGISEPYSSNVGTNPTISAQLNNNLVFSFDLVYPENNGLAARPDKIYLVNYVNPGTVDPNIYITQSTVNPVVSTYFTPMEAHPTSVCSALASPRFQRSIIQGQVSSATINTLTLAASSQNQNPGYYDGALLQITSGVGAGQTRRIIGYNKSTNVVEIEQAWTTIPLPTASYLITLDQPTQNYFGNELVNGECFYDIASKTVVISPWRAIQNLSLAQQAYLEPFVGTTFFKTWFSTTQFVEVPLGLLPPLGRQDLAIQAAGTFPNQPPSNPFLTGLSGLIFNTPAANTQPIILSSGSVVFQANSILAYEATGVAGATPSVGCKLNATVNGIEFPRYIGPANIRAVYYLNDYSVRGSGATNLLRFTGVTGTTPAQQTLPTRTLWIGHTGTNPSITFTLLGDVISGFDPTFVTAGGYVIVADFYGFSDGYMESNGRIMAPSAGWTQPSSAAVSVNVLTNSRGPVTGSNVQIVYDRNVYQGEIYVPQEEIDAPSTGKGPVSLANQVALEQPLLNPVSPNQYHFTALEQTDFATTLGTGRLSGKLSGQDFIQDDSQKYPDVNVEVGGLTTRLPLGSQYTDADFTGEAFALGEFNTNNVPFLGTGQPLTEIAGQIGEVDYSEEAIVSGNKFAISDGSHNFSYVTQFRTKRGGAAVQESGYQPGGAFASEHGVGNVFNKALYGVAALVKNNLELTPNTSSGGQTIGTGDGSTVSFTNVLLGTPITPSTVVVSNNGTQVGTDNGFGVITGLTLTAGSTVNYTTGVITLVFTAAPALGNAITATFTGHANVASAGGELQLVVGTGVVTGNNAVFKLVNSAGGAGEGASAVDRYRIPGRPIEKTDRHLAFQPLLQVAGPYQQDPTIDKTWITGVNPLVTDVDGLIQVYGQNLEEKRVFIRSASIPPTDMSAYTRRFVGGMEFSLPSYNTFWRPIDPLTSSIIEETYDLILVGQSGEVTQRGGAFQYHLGGLGTQKHLPIVGNFETYPIDAFPGDGSDPISKAWNCVGYTGTTGSIPPGPIFANVLKQGFKVSGLAAGSGYRNAGYFAGQGPQTITGTTITKQVATFNFQDLQSALLTVNETNTFVVGFKFSFAGGLNPGELMTSGFFFNTTTPNPAGGTAFYPASAFLAIAQASNDVTYKIMIGNDILTHSPTEIIDTTIPFDNSFHTVEFAFTTTGSATSFQVFFDGILQTNPSGSTNSVNGKIITSFAITDDATASNSTGAQAQVYVTDIYLKVQ